MISKCFKNKYSQRKAEDRGRKATEPGRHYLNTIKSLYKNIEIEKGARKKRILTKTKSL